MSTVPNAEFQQWDAAHTARILIRGQALLGTSPIAVGGATSGTVSAAYVNQQQSTEFKDELKIDAGYGATTFDLYAGEDGGAQGYPPTTDMELEIYKAALQSEYKTSETIPAQVQISLMQAARKAHNNWRQRRQQLLTQAQQRSANQVAINADMAKMTAGTPLDGITR